MANLNKVLLIGRLTRDPQQKFIPSGQSVVDVALAVNRNYAGALPHYDRSLEIDPTAWRIWSCRAESRKELGRREEALADYRRALELAPAEHRATLEAEIRRLE